MLPTPFIEWYQGQHERRSRLTGTEFEVYVTRALRLHHPDFLNPPPTGPAGDGGTDGLAEGGTISYACYGSQSIRDQQSRLISKMEKDLARAAAVWSSFNIWRFISNVPCGPNAAKWILEANNHWNGTDRRDIHVLFWTPDHVWTSIIRDLEPRHLNELYPGVPGAQNVELEDLVPLIDALTNEPLAPEVNPKITEVSAYKLEFNALHESTRIEFNEGRVLAPSIEGWFARNPLPAARDQAANAFRRIYSSIAQSTDEPRERVERCYIAVGGSDFRANSKRANAVYAITAYFFDSCDIFEGPPEDWSPGPAHASTN